MGSSAAAAAGAARWIGGGIRPSGPSGADFISVVHAVHLVWPHCVSVHTSTSPLLLHIIHRLPHWQHIHRLGIFGIGGEGKRKAGVCFVGGLCKRKRARVLVSMRKSGCLTENCYLTRLLSATKKKFRAKQAWVMLCICVCGRRCVERRLDRLGCKDYIAVEIDDASGELFAKSAKSAECEVVSGKSGGRASHHSA